MDLKVNDMELVDLIGKGNTVYLLDFSWHLYRSYYSFGSMTSRLSSGMEKPTGHIYGILRTMMQLRKIDPRCTIILCVDGVPKRRQEQLKSIGVEYKADRPKLEYNFYQDVDLILKLAYKMPRVFSAYHEEQESDDLMYSLARRLESTNPCVIFSGDDDLLQSINDRVVVLRKIQGNKPIFIDRDYVMNDERMVTKFRGCPPECLPFYRCVVGDKSDAMPGIPRFPKQLATELAKKVTCVEDYSRITNIYLNAKPSQQKYLKMIEDQYPRIKCLYEVMKLNEDIEYEIRRDEQSILNDVRELQLNSYYRYLSSIGVSLD